MASEFKENDSMNYLRLFEISMLNDLGRELKLEERQN